MYVCNSKKERLKCKGYGLTFLLYIKNHVYQVQFHSKLPCNFLENIHNLPTNIHIHFKYNFLPDISLQQCQKVSYEKNLNKYLFFFGKCFKKNL